MTATFVDIDEIRSAIADVRNDRTPTNWVLLTYQGENSNSIKLHGKGDGGVNELIDELQDNMVGYGLVRVNEKFDESEIIRFAFINWIGEKIHRMLRARLSTHSGAIKDIISPYHVDIQCSNKGEVSEDIVRSTVRKAAGTAVHVLDRAAPSSSSTAKSSPSTGRNPSAAPISTKAAGVPQQSQSVRFGDEQELRAAIRDVRNDSTPTNWVLATYEGANSNTVVLLGKGTGGTEELLEHLKDDIVAYGLIRQTEKYDESDRVMFAFVNWVGEGINRMLRAKLSTHSGAIKEMFAPYHVDINATNMNEISPEIVTTEIRDKMGTATRVRT